MARPIKEFKLLTIDELPDYTDEEMEELVGTAMGFYELDGEPHGPWESISGAIEADYMDKAHEELGY